MLYDKANGAAAEGVASVDGALPLVSLTAFQSACLGGKLCLPSPFIRLHLILRVTALTELRWHGMVKLTQLYSVPQLTCLDKFCELEHLSEDDLWYCGKCKELRRCTKQARSTCVVLHCHTLSSSRGCRMAMERAVSPAYTAAIHRERRGVTVKVQAHPRCAVLPCCGWSSFASGKCPTSWWSNSNASARPTSAHLVRSQKQAKPVLNQRFVVTFGADKSPPEV